MQGPAGQMPVQLKGTKQALGGPGWIPAKCGEEHPRAPQGSGACSKLWPPCGEVHVPTHVLKAQRQGSGGGAPGTWLLPDTRGNFPGKAELQGGVAGWGATSGTLQPPQPTWDCVFPAGLAYRAPC